MIPIFAGLPEDRGKRFNTSPLVMMLAAMLRFGVIALLNWKQFGYIDRMQLQKLSVPSSQVIDLIEATRLHNSGYSPLHATERKDGILARIDTPKWRQIMAEDVSWGWVSELGFDAASVYRSRYTKDRIVVPMGIYNRVKSLAIFVYWDEYKEYIGKPRKHYV